MFSRVALPHGYGKRNLWSSRRRPVAFRYFTFAISVFWPLFWSFWILVFTFVFGTTENWLHPNLDIIIGPKFFHSAAVVLETQRFKSLSTYSSRWPVGETGPWHLLPVCSCCQLCCEGHLAPDHLEDWVGESVGFESAVYISVKLPYERSNRALQGSAATSDFIKLQGLALLKYEVYDCKGSFIPAVLESGNLVGDVSIPPCHYSLGHSSWLIIVVSHQRLIPVLLIPVLLCWLLPI